MLKKKITVPTQLLLIDIVLDPDLQVRPVDDAVAKEYAEHLESLPPVTVWVVEGRYLLADGWHRYRAHQLAGATQIRVTILTGTIDDVKIFIAQCDIRVGVRRNRPAKRVAVTLVLGTLRAAEWSDRKVAAHCGVSHTFVGLIRARLAAGIAEDADHQTGDVATTRGDQLAEAPSKSGNVATEKGKLAETENGNVATTRDDKVSGNVATRQGNIAETKGGNVATADGAQERSVTSAIQGSVDATGDPHEQGEPASCGSDGEEQDEAQGLFQESERLTVNAILNSVEAFLEACDDDYERREALSQLLDAFSGMLSVLEDTGPDEEVPDDGGHTFE